MDTFCVLPWYSQEIQLHGASRACCLLPPGHDIDQIKKDLLSGTQHPACSKCWRLEQQNQKSRRQQENEFLDYKLDRDLDKIRQDCVDGNNQILLYQITTSNMCNQACVSCNSNFSSKWADIEKRQKKISKPLIQLPLEKTSINYANACRIGILGGEPLFDPATFVILEQLVANKNTQCFVSLITNGSIQLTSKHIELLGKFSDLNICVSIDGVGPVFEYMRWPGKWDVLLKNIQHFRLIAKTVSVSYTISSLNVFYNQVTTDWFDSMGLQYNYNIVTRPEWLSIASMPKEIKHAMGANQFEHHWKNHNVKETDLKLYQQHIISQDQAKRINMQDYMPELHNIIFNS